MKLTNVLREECIVVGAELLDKSAALHMVAQAAKKSPILKDVSEQDILDELNKRESLGSTGFGRGIAIPHCRLKGVPEFVVGLISVPTSVDFKALDDQKIKLIVFIIGPPEESSKYLKLLSAISRALLTPEAAKEILAEQTPEAMRESFLRYTFADIDTKDQTSKNLFHVFIQNEDVFRDILGILAVESNSVVVFDTENTGSYLAEISLFANFLQDSPRTFSKTIVAVVEKGLTNEALRRIEIITGDLNECSGVMVTVQEISYMAGALNAEG